MNNTSSYFTFTKFMYFPRFTDFFMKKERQNTPASPLLTKSSRKIISIQRFQREPTSDPRQRSRQQTVFSNAFAFIARFRTFRLVQST